MVFENVADGMKAINKNILSLHYIKNKKFMVQRCPLSSGVYNLSRAFGILNTFGRPSKQFIQFLKRQM